VFYPSNILIYYANIINGGKIEIGLRYILNCSIHMVSGANSSKYIMTVKLKINKTAGWDEYGKYGLGELRHMGNYSIKFDDDGVIFDTKNIKIVNVVEK